MEGVFQSGDVLDGKYRIERVIAEGGIAVVVLAEQLGLDRPVAIKLLRPAARANADIVEHFHREGSLAAKIKSEHVVRIHDVGERSALGPYMVMELLEGYDLEERLGSGPLPMEEAVDYVVQACDALAEAHHLHIVHRDIKPANLFLAARPPRPPILKIIDFGISKIVPRAGADGAWTSTDRTTTGTPFYMSPEQIRGEPVDARSDIWSLGVVLFELVTGVPPWKDDEPQRLLAQICSGKPKTLRELRPDLPAKLEAIILRCLAHDAHRRFASASELADALAPFRPAQALTTPTSPAAFLVAADPRRAAPTVVVSDTRKRRSTAFAVASAVAVAVGLAGIVLTVTALASKERASRASVASAPPPTASMQEPAPLEPTPSAAAAEDPASSSVSSASTSTARRAAPSRGTKAAKPRASAQAKTAPSPSDRSMFGERK